MQRTLKIAYCHSKDFEGMNPIKLFTIHYSLFTSKSFSAAFARNISLLLLAALMISCEGKVSPPLSALNPQELPSQESWNTQVVFSDSGITRAVLHAGHVRRYDKTLLTLMDSGVRVDFYNTLGLHTSVLTSQRAQVDDRTNDMIAEGNVVVVSDSGTTVTTEKMYWDNKNRKVHSDLFVRVVSPTEIIQGVGFEADQNLSNYTIYKTSGQKK